MSLSWCARGLWCLLLKPTPFHCYKYQTLLFLCASGRPDRNIQQTMVKYTLSVVVMPHSRYCTLDPTSRSVYRWSLTWMTCPSRQRNMLSFRPILDKNSCSLASCITFLCSNTSESMADVDGDKLLLATPVSDYGPDNFIYQISYQQLVQVYILPVRCIKLYTGVKTNANQKVTTT